MNYIDFEQLKIHLDEIKKIEQDNKEYIEKAKKYIYNNIILSECLNLEDDEIDEEDETHGIHNLEFNKFGMSHEDNNLSMEFLFNYQNFGTRLGVIFLYIPIEDINNGIVEKKITFNICTQ